MTGAKDTAEVGHCDDCGREIAPVSETCADCLGDDDREATLGDFGGGSSAE